MKLSGQVDTVVRQLRRVTGLSEAQRWTDSQLLEQYVACHDDNAFAQLVRRYGRLVRSVCRHVLHQEQDSDDAFQTTFLVFATKAASIRKTASVASWLYGVAYRTAMSAKRVRVRRRETQRESEGHAREQPVREAALREVQAILDEEVQRLSEKYRAAFILCCLEGKSRAEAARQLGVNENTVSSRLARARKDLHQRLARRGVVFSAALCAAELSRTAAAAKVPPGLLKDTIKGSLQFAAGKAVADLVPANVTILAKGALQTMFVTPRKLATVLLLTLGFLAVGAGLLRSQALAGKATPGQPQAVALAGQGGKAEAPAAPKKDEGKVVTISGRVLNPEGKPVAGAKLYLAKPAPWGSRPALSQPATSGPDGRFRFTMPGSDLDRDEPEEFPAQLMAVANGYGCDWVTLGAAAKEVTLRLVKDVPVRLRILDPDGKPVPGAKVTVAGVSTPKGDDLGSALDSVRKGRGYAYGKWWLGPLPGQAAVLTTGRDGRFRLSGAGRERIVLLWVEGPAIASRNLQVMTRAAKSVGKDDWRGMTVYGSSSDYVASASRTIRGVVRDKETGKPLAGVSVGGLNSRVKTVTDKDGRYELLGVAKGARSLLKAQPPDGLHFQRVIALQDTPGLGALTCNIELVRGLKARGRVTDKDCGKALSGARVEYYPLLGNTNMNSASMPPGEWHPCARATTGADGKYALTVLPGPGVILVRAPKRHHYMTATRTVKERTDFFKTPLIRDTADDHMHGATGALGSRPLTLGSYNGVVLLEPGPKEKELVKDVALTRPLERKGRVVGPDGRPLSGVTVYGLVRPGFGVETLSGPAFTVRGINPRGKRALIFHHAGKNLGFYLEDLRGEKAGPLTVKLQPCGSVSGRIVDPDGQPAAGLLFGVSGRGLFGNVDGQSVTTDKAGRFRVEGLVPGQQYLVIKTSDTRPSFHSVRAPVIVKPGEHKKMGDIKMQE